MLCELANRATVSGVLPLPCHAMGRDEDKLPAASRQLGKCFRIPHTRIPRKQDQIAAHIRELLASIADRDHQLQPR